MSATYGAEGGARPRCRQAFSRPSGAHLICDRYSRAFGACGRLQPWLHSYGPFGASEFGSIRAIGQLIV